TAIIKSFSVYRLNKFSSSSNDPLFAAFSAAAVVLVLAGLVSELLERSVLLLAIPVRLLVKLVRLLLIPIRLLAIPDTGRFGFSLATASLLGFSTAANAA